MFFTLAVSILQREQPHFIFNALSERYKFHDHEGSYFVTCTVVHWIDLFTRKHLKSNHFLDQKLSYIYNNLIEREIVEEPKHYLLSSAID